MLNQDEPAKSALPNKTNTVIYEDMENFAPKVLLEKPCQKEEARCENANAYTVSPSRRLEERLKKDIKVKTTKIVSNVKLQSGISGSIGGSRLRMINDVDCTKNTCSNEVNTEDGENEDHVYQELGEIQAACASRNALEKETPSSRVTYENITISKHGHHFYGTKRSLSLGCLDVKGLGGKPNDSSQVKNKLFSTQGKRNSCPPVPPPRTSSIKQQNMQTLEHGQNPDYEEMKNINGQTTGRRIIAPLDKDLPERMSFGKNTRALESGVSDVIKEGASKVDLSTLCGALDRGARPRSLSAPQTHDELELNSPCNARICVSPNGAINKNDERNSPKNFKQTLGSEEGASFKAKPSRKPPEKPQRSISMKEKLFGSNTLPRSKGTKTHHVRGLFEIPKDLRCLSVSGVCECLKILHMEELVERFSYDLIDGEILMEMTEKTMNDMGIDSISTLKLLKFIGGWRPRL